MGLQHVSSITLTTLSPLFCNGSNSRDHPEIRSPSIRGQLRYWLRAIEGAKSAELERIWDNESAIFGSTQFGSNVSIRVYRQSEAAKDTFDMLPHRADPQRRAPMKAIDANQSFELHLVTKPGTALPKRLKDALQIWLLLGGLGKRSRRMFGAITSNLWEENRFPNIESFKAFVEQLIPKIVGTPEKFADIYGDSIPRFPTLNYRHSRILIGYKGYSSAEDANKALFKVLRSNTYQPHQDHFGYAKGAARRASPLIAQVKLVGDKLYPVLTVMRSDPQLPDQLSINWSIYNRFLDDMKTQWNGQFVWGEPLQ